MTDPLITAPALKAWLDAAAPPRLLDATWHMPGSPHDAQAQFEAAHILGAVRFDIDAIADTASPLPHMLPTPQAFSQALGALGIGAGEAVVVYDRSAPQSAPRVWWMLRTMGVADVRVLDGGLDAWIGAGGALASGPAAPRAAAFVAKFRPALLRSRRQVEDHLDAGDMQVLDMRPAARFRGETAEPRAGLRSGHMPGALNLPSSAFYGADGRMLAPGALARLFADAGVAVERPVAATCGSGVTACIAALALARLGRWDTPVYDGSWAEWGLESGPPVAVGP